MQSRFCEIVRAKIDGVVLAIEASVKNVMMLRRSD